MKSWIHSGSRSAKTNVKLRSKPDSTDKMNLIHTLPKGTLVQVQDATIPYWFKVWCDNPQNPELKMEGYVNKRYFTPISDEIKDFLAD